MLKVAMYGFQSWGHVTLTALLEAGYEVPLVVTHRPGRALYESIFQESVEDLAGSHGIPILHRRYANDDEAVGVLRDSGAEIAVCSNWRTWLDPKVFSVPVHGMLNVHDGLLPAYGGLAPISWAIANGERSMGVTVHVVTEEFDLGPIVVQRELPIGDDETATSVYERSLPLFGSLAIDAVEAIATGTADLRPQDPAMASFFHARTDHESQIDWSRPRTEVHNLVRAQSDPFPNAHTTLAGRQLFVKRAHPARRTYSGSPGRVFAVTDEGAIVVCGRSSEGWSQGLVLDEVQLEECSPAPGPTVLDRHIGRILGEDTAS